MSKLKKANHPYHRFKKVNIGAFNKPPYWVYKCTKPNCSYYIRCELATDQVCECNRCGKLMLIGKQVMSQNSSKPMTLPHCEDCTKRRKAPNAEKVDAITEFLERNKTEVPVDGLPPVLRKD